MLHKEGLRLNLDNSRHQPHGPTETPEGRRGAWYSLAFLLRTVTAAQLDIQALELTGGIYSGVRHDVPTTFAFLADTLENGAGFSTHLGEPDVLAKLLDNVDDYLHGLKQPAHANDCSASCYKCLRDYSNMAYHALLDWRLAGRPFQLLRGQPLPDSRDSARTQSRRSGCRPTARVPSTGCRLQQRYGNTQQRAASPSSPATPSRQRSTRSSPRAWPRP